MILHRVMNYGTAACAAVGLTMFLGFVAPVLGASNILTPSGIYTADYQANDYYTDWDDIKAFDVLGDRVVIWTDLAGVQVLNRTTGAVENSVGVPQSWYDSLPGEVDIWNSFVAADPDGSAYWVGFSTSTIGQDRIFQVENDGGSWNWNHRATLASNWAIDFYGDNAYVSGLNSAAWGDPNRIWLLDTSGNNNHTMIANVGGNSAGLAFDAEGNLYYGTFTMTGSWPNTVTSGELYEFDNEDVAAGNLGLSDARKLADLVQGAGDIIVDDADQVIFTMNQMDGPWQVAMWNGVEGSGNNYDIIATGTGANGNFFSGIDASGDFTQGGILYVNDGNFLQAYPGLAGISAVPEPASAMMVLSGVLILLLWWRYRRNR